ncbi:MAG: hypothetical protein GX549_06285 [Clostridiales bacterium]|nr:hypothetical protein [Clostridiales bacterium]
MKNQRLWALMLTALMLAAMLGGCTQPSGGPTGTPASTKPADTNPAANPTDTPEPDPFAEPVHFTGSAVPYLSDGVDYGQDAVYEALSEKFNFTYQLYPLTWDNWAEKNRMWITSGEMPDFTMWNFNFTEYVNYAEQALIAPMPEGWDSAYPNLYAMVDATGLREKVTLDGKISILPRATFKNFAPIQRALSHQSLIYRDDYREQLGMDPIGDTITLEQLNEYLSGCTEQGLSRVGLSSNYAGIVQLFVSMHESGFNTFFVKDGQYVWGPAQPGTLEGIKLLKEQYDEGIIDPDFYLNNSKEHREKFAAGMIPMMYDDGTVNNLDGRINEFIAANPGADGYNMIKMTTAVGPDGKWHGTESGNFWASTIFKPDIEEEVHNRILALLDYVCTVEGQELVQLGIEGTDWERNADGSYAILRPKNEDGTYPLLRNIYPSCALWYQFGVLVDDFSFVDPTRDTRVVDSVISMYKTREQNGNFLEFDPDYQFFVSDAKSVYSVDVASEIVRIIMTDGVDIDAEWAKFIETQKPMWEPVLNDLNEAFGS